MTRVGQKGGTRVGQMGWPEHYNSTRVGQMGWPEPYNMH